MQIIRLDLRTLSCARDIVDMVDLCDYKSYDSSVSNIFSSLGSSLLFSFAIVLNDAIASSSRPMLSSHSGDSGIIATNMKIIKISMLAA